jgi:hypothetical protein
VAAAVDRERDVLLTGDIDRGGDVVGAGAAGDERGLAVDHRVEHRAGVVVAGVARFDEFTAEARNLETCRADVSHACPLSSLLDQRTAAVFHAGGDPGSVPL